ncbi:DNA repair protein [Micromonospora krabiensis]|nr:hypothetical protein [Micromonospora krabiensis]
MPIQPNDRYQQDTARLRRFPDPGRFPAQPPHHGARAADGTALSWAEVNRLPAGASARRGLGSR